MILGLDLGTKTGWATGTNSNESGVWDLKPDRFQSPGMRFAHFSRYLSDLYRLKKFDAVFYEEVRMHMGVDAGHAYGGFLATLQMFCETKKIPYDGVPVGTIKKHATGKGVAPKDKMLAAAVKAFPKVNIVDHNQADALFVWRIGLERLSDVQIDFTIS